MKKYLFSLLLLTPVFSPHATFAADKTTAAQTAKSDSGSQILLYEKPDTQSHVLTNLRPDDRIIPFYKEKDWIKIGLPQNGQTGWVNTKQYIQARENFYRQNVQSVYVQVKESAGDKTSKTIIAYKNGKKLSDAEAAKLYQQMQQENQRKMRFWLSNAVIFDELNQNFSTLQGFNDGFFSAPIIILQDSGAEKTPEKNRPAN